MKRRSSKGIPRVDASAAGRHDMPPRPAFSSHVIQSVEPLDLDAWLDRYVRAIATAKSQRHLAA